MLHEKVIATTLDVPNPISFAADPTRQIGAALREKFVGRCFKGAYIVRVVRLLQRSAVTVTQSNPFGGGFVDVQFLAEVAVLCRWDILVGVRIASNGQMVCGTYSGDARGGAAEPLEQKGENPRHAAAPVSAVVCLLAKKESEQLAVNQRVAVRIVHAVHSPMADSITAAGVLLTCEATAPVYRLRGELGGAAQVELGPMLAAIEAELAARAGALAAQRESFWFFETLLHTYRAEAGAPLAPPLVVAGGGENAGAWEGPASPGACPPGATDRSLLEILRRVVRGEAVDVSGEWSRAPHVPRSSPLVTFSPRGGVLADAAEAEAGEPAQVFALFAKNALDFLVATRELVALFASAKMIEDHSAVWAAMRSAQTLAPALAPA